MAEPVFEASKEGIKLSYGRFLADSATGMVLMLLLVAVYYFPVVGPPLNVGLGDQLGSEVKIFVLILLFLLTTPVGLMINTVSWLFFGRIQIIMEVYFFKKRGSFLLQHIEQEFGLGYWITLFGLNAANFYEVTEFADHAFGFCFPNLQDPIAHVRGAYRFARSIALILLLTIVFCLYVGPWDLLLLKKILWLGLGFAGLTFLGAAAAYYRSLSNLQRLYLLMLKHKVTGESIQCIFAELAAKEGAMASQSSGS